MPTNTAPRSAAPIHMTDKEIESWVRGIASDFRFAQHEEMAIEETIKYATKYLQEARIEGARLGLEAAAKVCREQANQYVEEANSSSATRARRGRHEVGVRIRLGETISALQPSDVVEGV